MASFVGWSKSMPCFMSTVLFNALPLIEACDISDGNALSILEARSNHNGIVTVLFEESLHNMAGPMLRKF
jgi:hypothetical protein